MKRRIVFLLVVVISVVSLGSCRTLLSSMSFSKKDLGGPEGNALIFGSLGYQGLLGIQPFGIPNFIQLNPNAEPAAVRPFVDGTMYFFYPRPVGESWKLNQFSITVGRTTTTYYLGVNGREKWDPRTGKPGLVFAGSYEFSSAKLLGPSTDEIIASETPTELELLRKLLGYYRDTAWEQVIQDRIGELSK